MPFRQTHGGMRFVKKQEMEKIVEDLKPDDLVESTHSDWADPSLILPTKDGT